MKALVLEKTAGSFKPGPSTYHPAPVVDLPIPVPTDDQVLVKVLQSAFNHRDLFQRQSLYPGTIFHTPEQHSVLGADAVGIVLSKGHPLSGQTVLLSPEVGWHSNPLGPDQKEPFGILGSVKQSGGRGTFAEYIAVGKDDVVKCPQHFLDGSKEGISQAAALPLALLTAYRAVFTKGRVRKGDNVFITGIGGGVAVTALQLCVAAGANVWVSSSSEEKIKKAVSLGAKGGVNYKDATWPTKLGALLPKERPTLDTVIDSGGGPIANQVVRIMKHGGVVSCYGSTTGQDVPISMGFILKNLEFRGSTMGSRDEFFEAVKFVEKHKIRPFVHVVLPSLESAEEGFELMKQGGQFGRIVMNVERERQSGKL